MKNRNRNKTRKKPNSFLQLFKKNLEVNWTIHKKYLLLYGKNLGKDSDQVSLPS